MSEVEQMVQGISARVRAMRSVCPDGPLWDALAALQLEVVVLAGEVRSDRGGAQRVVMDGARVGAGTVGKMAAANDHSLD